MLIMISTGMLSAGMTLTMMIAVCPCVHQFPAQVCFHCFISTPGSACTQLNPAFGKSRLGAATNTAAYQDIDLLVIQKTCQSTVAAPVRSNDFTVNDPTIPFIYCVFCFRLPFLKILVTFFFPS
jgi:uncharacterized membrane protein (UPF0182 family)